MSRTALTAPGVDVEVATWVPTTRVEVDGWVVGLSGGFTRRANSAVPRGEPDDVAATLDGVEEVYAAHGLPSIVRVCSAALPAGLDDALADRGYARVAPTAVMVAPLTGAREDAAVRSPADATGSVVVRVADEPTPAWLDGWLEVKVATAGGVDLATAAQILRASPALYLSAEEHDGVVGVVRLALAGHWAGISSLTVRTRARRRGIGRLLTCAALDGAVEHGASAAFLQVEESNRAAVGLYEGLGFGVADRYHYRQR